MMVTTCVLYFWPNMRHISSNLQVSRNHPLSRMIFCSEEQPELILYSTISTIYFTFYQQIYLSPRGLSQEKTKQASRENISRQLYKHALRRNRGAASYSLSFYFCFPYRSSKFYCRCSTSKNSLSGRKSRTAICLASSLQAQRCISGVRVGAYSSSSSTVIRWQLHEATRQGRLQAQAVSTVVLRLKSNMGRGCQSSSLCPLLYTRKFIQISKWDEPATNMTIPSHTIYILSIITTLFPPQYFMISMEYVIENHHLTLQRWSSGMRCLRQTLWLHLLQVYELRVVSLAWQCVPEQVGGRWMLARKSRWQSSASWMLKFSYTEREGLRARVLLQRGQLYTFLYSRSYWEH